jgi:DNA polymerase-3 subunit delta'
MAAAPARQIHDQTMTGLSLDHQLVGHGEQQQAFLDALASGRMHHAWLLHGPEGLGKARFAAQAAAYLTAEAARNSGDTLDIDLAHPDTRLVAQGAHPDLHWIDRQSTSDGKRLPKVIPVAAVRAMLHKLQSTAAYGGWRVLVVDALDELNVEGANALLKPLEEPAKKTVLLLIAHAFAQVLPTIRSRCRHLAFAPLGSADMQVLAKGWGDDDGQSLAIGLAQGRPGLMSGLGENPSVLEIYRRFCALSAQTGRDLSTRNFAERLDFASDVNALGAPARDLMLALIEDWLSRRVRCAIEPAGLPAPSALLDPAALSALADLWSEHTAAVGTRLAINLDVTERIMVLFDRLDHVYSHR